MHAETHLGVDNRPAETPLGRLERALGAAREVVIRQQDALIDNLGAQIQRFLTGVHLDKDGVAFFDDDGKVVVANSRYSEIYGLGPDAVLKGAAAPDTPKRKRTIMGRYVFGDEFKPGERWKRRLSKGR